jgi:flagellar biosynthesis/type III secretory pathway protein FliH
MSDAQIDGIDLTTSMPSHLCFKGAAMGAEAAPSTHNFAPTSFAPCDRAAHDLVPEHDPYQAGYNDGQRAAQAIFETDRQHLISLFDTITAEQASPREALSALIGEAVYHLVAEIVGYAPVDQNALVKKAQEAVDLIADYDEAQALLLHPDDCRLLENAGLSLPVTGDATLKRGDVRLACSAGSIESGTSLYLETLSRILQIQGQV